VAPRYDVSTVAAIADGPDAVRGLLSQLLGAFNGVQVRESRGGKSNIAFEFDVALDWSP
jgi:hypothetical protein